MNRYSCGKCSGYYYGDDAEYDIKSDELSTEAENIADEYRELLNSIKWKLPLHIIVAIELEELEELEEIDKNL